MLTELPEICVPPNTDYVSVLQIDRVGKATLTTETNTGSKILFDANETASTAEVLNAVFNQPAVSVKADPSLSFDLVVKILRGVRQALDKCINVEASTRTDDPYVYISPEPKEVNNMPVFPHPLRLVVQLKENGDISLNNERQGSMNNTSTLKTSLEKIFRDREDNAVFRKGTYVVEKTVSLKPVLSSKFGDIVKIVDALKEAGASPIGLQIDELDNTTDIQLEVVPEPEGSEPRK